jgi:hypothetical protein
MAKVTWAAGAAAHSYDSRKGRRSMAEPVPEMDQPRIAFPLGLDKFNH